MPCQLERIKQKVAKQLFSKTPESPEYRTWRNRFLRQRLKVCLYLGTACILTFFVYESINLGLDLNLLEAYTARLVLIILGIAWYQSSWGRSQPQYLLLWASWTMTTLPDFWMMIRGLPTSSVVALNLVFVVQTTFLPVYWRIHAVSQSIRILVGILTLFYSGDNLSTLDERESPLIYWLWLYAICVMAVYFYEQLQKQEFESHRELNILLHSVSHDLRAPATGTSMVLQNLLNKAQKNNGEILISSSILARLLQGSDRQLTMINSLLDTQEASQQVKLNYCPCRLNDLVQSIVRELEPILDQNEVSVINAVPRDLPLINVDSLQLRRVFNNLITNAFKHNPYGVKLTIKAIAKDNQVKIYLADNGVGIPRPQQSKLFELYARGENARYMPGLGMGLYLCRQIIIAHGGEIGCHSYPQQGATFWFTLPLDRA